MKLSTFTVVHARTEGVGDPLIHCHAGKQLVLTYIERKALEDYSRFSGEQAVTLQQWNLVVDRNLEALKPIIEEKYERDDWQVHNAYGQSYPKLVLTLEDLRRTSTTLTFDVLNLNAGFQPRL